MVSSVFEKGKTYEAATGGFRIKVLSVGKNPIQVEVVWISPSKPTCQWLGRMYALEPECNPNFILVEA